MFICFFVMENCVCCLCPLFAFSRALFGQKAMFLGDLSSKQPVVRFILAVLRSFAKGLTFSGFTGKSLLNQRG